MASRSLDDLAEPVKRAALDFLEAARGGGLEVLIYCTLRPLSEQARLYEVGRSVPGKILTNARPGDSLHNPDALGKAWAFDAVPLLHGKPVWDDVAMLDAMGWLGESFGLEWAGRWRGRLRERVHFQITRGQK